MRIKADLGIQYFINGIMSFLITMTLCAFLLKWETLGFEKYFVVVFLVLLIRSTISSLFNTKKIHRATITIEDGFLEYRQGEYDKEKYEIQNMKFIQRVKVIKKKLKNKDGTDAYLIEEYFIMLVDVDENIFKLPIGSFFEKDITELIEELKRQNSQIDIKEDETKIIE